MLDFIKVNMICLIKAYNIICIHQGLNNLSQNSEYKYTKEWVKVKNTDDLVVDCNYNTSKCLIICHRSSTDQGCHKQRQSLSTVTKIDVALINLYKIFQ